MATPLKDRLDRDVVELLGERLAGAYRAFDTSHFVSVVLVELPSLELKERVNLVADQVAAHLPNDYVAALEIVVQVAAEGIDEWAAWPLCSFVERHGADFPVESLDAMAVLTTQWSCEFAIRPFLDTHLDLTRGYLRRWVLDPNELVRRLPSEGTRPLLPWGPRVAALTHDPQIGIEVLNALRFDESETVRRSVANHLNDIAKSHPDLVVDLLAVWLEDPSPVDERMVRHALRTLVKLGHPGALSLLGFTIDAQVDVRHFTCVPDSIELGSEIRLDVEISSTSRGEQLLVIDFVIHHVNSSGSTSAKVFKWATRKLAPGETINLTKRRLIQTASTRRYHPGVHRVDLQVAGKVVGSAEFLLATPAVSRR